MNVLAFQRVRPDSTFPWFDDYSQHNTFCKVYNDGSSYIAIPSGKIKGKRRKRDFVPGVLDELFDALYLQALKANVKRKDIPAYIKSGILERYPEAWGVDDLIERNLNRVYRNLAARKKRFRRKAYLNKWNYFVTFTYSDELRDEESFRQGLRKCLSNLHSRRGWLYMGVFERAPDTQRLHFHCLMYVPDGQMVGEIYERRDYSTKQHKMQISHGNKFFESRFGRCDFASLSDAELRRGNTLSYLLKYLEKTEERIVYSRGIPSEFYREISEDEIVCEMVDFVLKYILFDDVIDYDVDVKHSKSAPETLLFYDLEPLPS